MTDLKRKITLFVSAAIVADFLLDTVYNLLRINVSLFSQSDSASNILSFSLSAVTLVLFLVLGYVLSKDKDSAIVFSGAIYFASYLPNFILTLVSVIVSYFSLTDGVSPLLSVFEFITGVILVPLEIFIGVYAYTAFVGINDKLSEEGMAGFTMSLSRARKRFIVATVIQTVVASLFTSIPIAFSLFIDGEISEFPGYIVRLCAWISSVAVFFVIYYAGYKPGKNHTEAMAFFSAYALGGGIYSLISSFFIIAVAPVISKILTSGIGDEVTQEVLSDMFTVVDADAFSLAATSPILFILSVAVVLYIFKFFFERRNENSEFYAQ